MHVRWHGVEAEPELAAEMGFAVAAAAGPGLVVAGPELGIAAGVRLKKTEIFSFSSFSAVVLWAADHL